jgi:hypothetical protein
LNYEHSSNAVELSLDRDGRTTSGLTITAGTNGSATIIVTGSIASLNAALSGLTYRPTAGYTGSDSLAISLADPVDHLSASTSVALTVSNSPPAITAPATATVSVTSALTFSAANKNAISIADVNAGAESLFVAHHGFAPPGESPSHSRPSSCRVVARDEGILHGDNPQLPWLFRFSEEV